MDWAWADGTASRVETGAVGLIGQTRNIILTAAGEAISERRPEPIDRTAPW